MNKRSIGLTAFVVFTVVAILHFIGIKGWVNISETVLFASRWIFIATIILFAFYKKSLTTWILVWR